MQPIYDFGGPPDAPLLNLAPANGFTPATYRAFIAPLTAKFHAVSLPPRPLWPDEPVPATYHNWRDLIAADLLAGMRAYNMRDVVLVGHSFGAVASLIAAVTEPERVRGLVLLDPTILPRSFMWIIAALRLFGKRISNGAGERADVRRTHFDSHDEAFTYFRGKRLFHDWTDDALWDYVHSLVPDGAKLTLAWPREWEAYIFRTLYTGVWREVAAVPDDMPVLVVRGETSDIYREQTELRMREVLSHAEHVTLPGYGHLFPHAAPAAAADLVRNWLWVHI